MSERIDSVTVLGGGDVGLLTALALRQYNPGLDVEVIDDFSRDIPQVGKSTYKKITDILHQHLGIDEREFVTEVKPVWKASVYFRDWCDSESFHYPFDEAVKYPDEDRPDAVEWLYYHYSELYDSPDHRTANEERVEQRKSPWFYSPQQGGHDIYPHAAYHLNTERFNGYLRELCQDRGVSLVNDEITGVNVSGAHVERVRSKSQTYESDLFVDATGFNRVIRGEIDAEFREFPLPLDTAFNVRVDRDLSEVIPATVVDSGEYGWFWTIDTYDNRDRGYVFASEYVDDDAALAEFLDEVDDSVTGDDVAKYEFTSGYYPQAWEDNLVALGNAEGFVEPLQSTGLTANAHAAVRLSRFLSEHGRVNDAAVREDYNTFVRQGWESIYDFVAVHYRYGDGDTAFWEDVTTMGVSRRVELLEEAFDRRGFVGNIEAAKRRGEVDRLRVFLPRNFFLIMRQQDATSDFYEEHDFEVSRETKQQLDEYYRQMREDVETYLTTEEMYRGPLAGM